MKKAALLLALCLSALYYARRKRDHQINASLITHDVSGDLLRRAIFSSSR